MDSAEFRRSLAVGTEWFANRATSPDGDGFFAPMPRRSLGEGERPMEMSSATMRVGTQFEKGPRDKAREGVEAGS